MKSTKYNLKFKVLSVKENTDSIYQFLVNEDIDNWFTNTIFEEFNINKSDFLVLNEKQRYNYIYKIVDNVYSENDAKINEIAHFFQEKWNEKSDEISGIFAEIFGTTFDSEKICVVNVGLNPICPRYLNSKSFDINYKLNNFLTICIHELLHFYWFDYWDKNIGKLKAEEKETPSIIWQFSEIAIDQLVNCTELKKFYNETNVAYDYFYDIKHNGKYLIDVLREMYNKLNLKDFMLQGLQLLKSDEIKSQL